jgi:hypothetical protein
MLSLGSSEVSAYEGQVEFDMNDGLLHTPVFHGSWYYCMGPNDQS